MQQNLVIYLLFIFIVMHTLMPLVEFFIVVINIQLLQTFLIILSLSQLQQKEIQLTLVIHFLEDLDVVDHHRLVVSLVVVISKMLLLVKLEDLLTLLISLK